jgi:hypothetical protein
MVVSSVDLSTPAVAAGSLLEFHLPFLRGQEWIHAPGSDVVACNYWAFVPCGKSLRPVQGFQPLRRIQGL